MEEEALKRIKFWELFMGALFILIGLSGVDSGEMYRWDVPILYPRLFGGALIVVGVGIPIVAWFIRTPSRNNNNK
ncbi:MAG: hypothetical protein JEY79_02525 [Pseudodesulfovibrio sp.]|nr:hypothetical protein [Pseudodesulfovibrio sp.]